MQEWWRLESSERTSIAALKETWPAQTSYDQDGAGGHGVLG